MLKWCNVLLIWSALPQCVCESASLYLYEFILKKDLKIFPVLGMRGETLLIAILVLFSIYNISVLRKTGDEAIDRTEIFDVNCYFFYKKSFKILCAKGSLECIYIYMYIFFPHLLYYQNCLDWFTYVWCSNVQDEPSVDTSLLKGTTRKHENSNICYVVGVPLVILVKFILEFVLKQEFIFLLFLTQIVWFIIYYLG